MARRQGEKIHYDLVVMADCSLGSRHYSTLRVLLDVTTGQGHNVALFHWPDYTRIEETAERFLKMAVGNKLDLLLPDQEVQAESLVILDSELLRYPPDTLPKLRCPRKKVLDSLDDVIRWLFPEMGKESGSEGLLVAASALFNAGWYLWHNRDVAEAGVDPVNHYLNHGWREGRRPGPLFDPHFYLSHYRRDKNLEVAPLLEYLRGEQKNSEAVARIAIKGDGRHNPEQPTLMLCAHAAPQHLFGAERCLLDVLRACADLPLNVILTVPEVHNCEYIEALRAYVFRIVCVPATPWSSEQGFCDWAVNRYREIIRDFSVAAVQVNTLTLQEPLLAARAENVPALQYVHESLDHDVAMRTAIGLDAEQIRQQVLRCCDVLLANSEFTARKFFKPNATCVVGNVVDCEALNIPNRVDPRCIKVGMISSNIPKKGLDDFIEVARLLRRKRARVKMLLIGPETEYTRRISEDIKAGKLPDNIECTGYIEDPVKAVSQVNIVLNLSLFEETFGRTVLEAMAARRPVIAYNWGALPELIMDEENGFLVYYQDVEAVAERIMYLSEHISRIILMGAKGRKIACGYGLNTMQDQLREVFKLVWPDFSITYGGGYE
jgi:glycosyltransferase involved in cell wall biosynthesis